MAFVVKGTVISRAMGLLWIIGTDLIWKQCWFDVGWDKGLDTRPNWPKNGKIMVGIIGLVS